MYTVDYSPDSLHRAIWDGNLEAVKSLLGVGLDLDARDAQGCTPLSRAIERRQPKIAKLLIEQGADVQARDKRGRQPLLWAARYGPDALVEKLMERGVDVTSADDHGKMPLVEAILHGRTAIAEILLRQGEWPKGSKNYYWSQGFFLAIRNRRFGTVKAFLDQGQSPNTTMHRRERRQFYEQTALMEAAVSGDLEVLELLLRRGADLQKKSKRRSALTEALIRRGKHATFTLTLLHEGAHLGLEEAVVTGDLALAEQLLSGGADVEMPDADGQTLLTWAAFHGQADAVRLLTWLDADPKARDRYGNDALMGAAATGNVALAEFLIERGADVNAVGSSWKTALAYAAEAGQTDTMRWFLGRFGLGADLGASALTAAAAGNQLEAVRLLLNAGVEADAHTPDLYGRRALMWAAWKGNVPMVRLLLERGADVNATESPGRSALSFAAGAGRKRVIPLLIEGGIVLDQKDKGLLEALQGGHSGTAELLLQGGADPNAVGYAQQTALMWAAKNGTLSLVQVLLSKGAAVNAVDKDGKTAMIWAKQAGHGDVTALLERNEQG